MAKLHEALKRIETERNSRRQLVSPLPRETLGTISFWKHPLKRAAQQEATELRTQLEILTRRLDLLEDRLSNPVATGPDVALLERLGAMEQRLDTLEHGVFRFYPYIKRLLGLRPSRQTPLIPF
ncbi:MAG: hypothetical protein ACE5I7_15075 [Candidatus Binatia bacterium]